MDGLISKHELDRYMENNSVQSDEEKKLIESFEQLTQTKNKSDFHFTDKRGATVFVVSRLDHNKLYVRKYFDAPAISLAELSKVLPIESNGVIFFTEWLSGTYAWVYKITKMFYEINSRVFQIPVYELINEKMGYETGHKGFVTLHAITTVEMAIENESELLIEIQMDKYGNGRLLRDEIKAKYKVSLDTLDIIESNITSESYSLK
jgi:hypothetical protein